MLNICIGFDKAETVAYHTLVQSIINTTSVPVSITPVKLSMLPGYTRERDPHQSNEFAFSRFLVPYLMNYHGWAVFMDCDMLVRTDLKELWALRDQTKSVQVIKHDYVPKNDTKYLGNIQYPYPRKNWSSVMMFNCAHDHCKRLTMEYVKTADPMALHRFFWTHEDFIGELPVEWNHLVGEYPPNMGAKIVHHTNGGPWFDEYRGVEFSDEWRQVYDDVRHADQLIIPTVKRA